MTLVNIEHARCVRTAHENDEILESNLSAAGVQYNMIRLNPSSDGSCVVANGKNLDYYRLVLIDSNTKAPFRLERKGIQGTVGRKRPREGDKEGHHQEETKHIHSDIEVGAPEAALCNIGQENDQESCAPSAAKHEFMPLAQDCYLSLERFGKRIHTSNKSCHTTNLHHAPICCIDFLASRIASIDIQGHVIIADFDLDGNHASVRSQINVSSCFAEEQLDPVWCGIALSKECTNAAKHWACINQTSRRLSMFENEQPVRNAYCLQNPVAIQFMDTSAVNKARLNRAPSKKNNMDPETDSCSLEQIVIAEGNYVSIWDARVGEKRGFVHRRTPCKGNITALSVYSPRGLVAAAGLDRTVHVYDIRTMSVYSRWTNVLKYECAFLSLCDAIYPGICVVGSVDNEVNVGIWDSAVISQYQEPGVSAPGKPLISGAAARSARRLFGLRADDRIVGFDACPVSDHIAAGFVTSSAFYSLQF